MATTELREHALGEADLEGGLALVREVGWNQVAADWRIFLELGAAHGLSTPSGRLVATAATLPYGGRFAWISMVLVSADFRQRGLATRLMQHAIDALRTRGLVPILDATPAGREVYARIGFQDCWGLERLMLPGAQGASGLPGPGAPGAMALIARAGCAVTPLTDADWGELVAFDSPGFGADRSQVLSRLRSRLPQSAFVARRDGAVCGYALARDGRTATQIGPVCAEDEETAIALLAAALGTVRTPVTLDLACRHGATGAWLREFGFTMQRSFTRMALGQARAFDDGYRIVAAAGPELG
jgi:GNAT superfamily N-acetyltransferase